MTRRPLLALLLAASAALACSHAPPRQKVLEPPAYDLHPFGAVGLLQFTSSSSPNGNLPQYATQRFLAELQQAQPGVRILELGNAQQALASVGKTQLDVDAVKLLAQKYGIQALLAGDVEVTKAQPKVNVSGFLSAGQVGMTADVTSQLTAKLYEAASGATLWSQTLADKDQAGSVTLSADNVDIGAEGTENVYARMVSRSVREIADPFRSHWVYR